MKLQTILNNILQEYDREELGRTRIPETGYFEPRKIQQISSFLSKRGIDNFVERSEYPGKSWIWINNDVYDKNINIIEKLKNKLQR